MQIELKDMEKALIASKCQSFYKVRIENKSDYLKVKYILSRIPIRWAANDFTHTLYFCGKKMDA